MSPQYHTDHSDEPLYPPSPPMFGDNVQCGGEVSHRTQDPDSEETRACAVHIGHNTLALVFFTPALGITENDYPTS